MGRSKPALAAAASRSTERKVGRKMVDAVDGAAGAVVRASAFFLLRPTHGRSHFLSHFLSSSFLEPLVLSMEMTGVLGRAFMPRRRKLGRPRVRGWRGVGAGSHARRTVVSGITRERGWSGRRTDGDGSACRTLRLPRHLLRTAGSWNRSQTGEQRRAKPVANSRSRGMPKTKG